MWGEGGVQAGKGLGGGGQAGTVARKGGGELTMQFSAFLSYFTLCNCLNQLIFIWYGKYPSFGFYFRKIEPGK